jgi:D-glycero-D-manno-heptose 1,7-bisphosphate phosphatase
VLTVLIWLLPLQSMVFLPGFPYISPPAILPALFGLVLLAIGDRPAIWREMRQRTPLGLPILAFIVYTIVHGVLADLQRQAILEQSVLGGEFLRQVLSLLSGYVVYVYARLVLVSVDGAWVLRRLRHSIAPHLALGLMAATATVLGMQAFDGALAAVRSIVIPGALAAQSGRATGLATEPSYYGILLVSIYAPAFVAAWRAGQLSRAQWAGVAVLLVNITATASLSTFICLGVVGLFLLARKARYLLFAAPVVFVAGVAVTSLLGNSDSYALVQLNSAVNNVSGDAANASLSFLDTWYSYAGPMQLYDGHLLVGLGLGGTETHIASVFPEEVASALRAEFEKDRVGVLVARVLVEQGLLGFLLFHWLWIRAWRLIRLPSAAGGDRCERLLKWTLLGCYAGYFVKLGSFSLPYMWRVHRGPHQLGGALLAHGRAGSARMSTALARAVFLDRDGVINVERNYVHRIEDFAFLPGVFEGLAMLRDAGLRLVVVTNQAGIGRGLYDEAAYQRLTTHMRDRLRERGIELAGVYHCPHHPTAGIGEYLRGCDCRKPGPGLLLQAARELSIDLAQSALVGDKLSDVQAGRASGLGRCVLVGTGHALAPADLKLADASFTDLRAAATWLVEP